MGIIFTDIGFFIIILIIFGLGAAASVGEWILDHLILIGIIFAVKSLLTFRKNAFGKRQTYRLLSFLIVLLDIARGVCTLICAASILDDVLSNGLIDLVLGVLLTIPVMGCFLIVASDGAMIPVYMNLLDAENGLNNKDKGKAVVCEIISIAALGAYYLIVDLMK